MGRRASTIFTVNSSFLPLSNLVQRHLVWLLSFRCLDILARIIYETTDVCITQVFSTISRLASDSPACIQSSHCLSRRSAVKVPRACGALSACAAPRLVPTRLPTAQVLTEESSAARLAAGDEEYNEYMFDLTVHGLPLYEHATGEPLPGEHDYKAHQVILAPCGCTAMAAAGRDGRVITHSACLPPVRPSLFLPPVRPSVGSSRCDVYFVVLCVV